MSKFTSSYDVDNRYRFYKSLNPQKDISKTRRGVRPGVDDNSRKNFLSHLFRDHLFVPLTLNLFV